MYRSAVCAILVVVLFAPALAGGVPAYNRSTEVVLEGKVLFAGEGPLGVYVILKDRAEQSGQVNEILVELAPVRLLTNEGIRIGAGDKIRVIGSRVMSEGCEVILARQLTKEGRTVTLREVK